MATTQPPPSESAPPSTIPSPDEMQDIAQEFVLSMMASASTQRIRPTDWWERARTALEYAARSAQNPRHMVTLFARKIHAETLTASTTDRLSCLSSLEYPPAFAAFRRMVDRESTYIVAFAQQRRADERAEAGIVREAMAPTEAKLATALDELRKVKADRDRWMSKANDEAENARVLKLALTKETTR